LNERKGRNFFGSHPLVAEEATLTATQKR